MTMLDADHAVQWRSKPEGAAPVTTLFADSSGLAERCREADAGARRTRG
jgi:hypothetical protein